MSYGQYILDSDGNPKLEPDLLTWAMWLEHSHVSPGKDNRILERDYVGDVFISTVFLGLDHQWPPGKGKPVLWETMIFGGKEDQYQRRYTSRTAALAGHVAAVELVKHSDRGLKELERLIEISGGWTKK